MVIKDHNSVLSTNHQGFSFCTETADSADPLQECDYSHCLTQSVTLMPELLVQQLKQQKIALSIQLHMT